MTTLPPPLEKDIQTAILDYLLMRGHFAWRQNTGGIPLHGEGKEGRFRPAPVRGVSDILGVAGEPRKQAIDCATVPRKGTFFAVEVKRPGKKPTADQLKFLNDVLSHGGVGIVATSVDDCIAAGL